MVRKYDYSIDYVIAYSIYNYGSLTYRRLKGIIEGVEYLNRTSLSRDTYHFHFKKMKSGNYIFARNTDEWKRGKRLFYSLTDSIREQLDLNTLVIQHVDENKREKVSSSYRRLKKYYQQLSEHAQIGLKRRRIQYIIFKVISRESPYRDRKYPGVSVSDIINERYYSHYLMYLPRNEDRKLFEESITKLQEQRIVRLVTDIPSREDPRYEFVHPIWKYFIQDCSELFSIVDLRSHISWKYIKQPSPQERLDHELRWGKTRADSHMIEINDHKTIANKLDKDRKITSHRKKDIPVSIGFDLNNYVNLDPIQKTQVKLSSIDYYLYTGLQKLKEKYRDLLDKYNDTCNNIIEILYPKDLQMQIERKIKNPNNECKKYFAIKKASFTDVLNFRDSTHVRAF